MDRPEKLNAIDKATADELHGCFADFDASDPEVMTVMKSTIASAVVPVESSMLTRRLSQYTSQISRLTS